MSSETGAESSVTTDQSDEDWVEELEPDTQDYLAQYAREDETPAETLDRLIRAAVPHRYEVKQIGIEPTEFDEDSEFIYERWPDTDGHVDTRIYGGIEEFIHGHETAIQFVGGDD